MKVTLRKARKIEQAIGTAINSIELSSKGNISMFEQDVTAVYISRTEEAQTKIENFKSLVSDRQIIRDSINTVNTDSGITTLISERKGLMDINAKYGAMVESITDFSPADVIAYHAAKVEKDAAENESGDRYFRGAKTEYVGIPLYTNEDAERMSQEVKALNKQIANIDDKLFEMNATNGFQLEDSLVERLEAHGII